MIDIETIIANTEKELGHISVLLAQGKSEQNECKQTLIAIRLFDYLEHHHYALKYRDGFKSVVQTKADEFRREAVKRRTMLERMDPNIADYGRAEYLSLLTDSLSESCERVLTIMWHL